MSKPSDFLKAGEGLNWKHPEVRAYARHLAEGREQPVEKATAIFYAVRDGWRYNPYNFSFRAETLRASHVLKRKEGHCLDKGILMTALLRAVGIPARLCLAKVRNHIAAERMIQAFGTDELVPHGYVEVVVQDRWLKVTPAFNRALCERLDVAPLEFDGTSDALFQQFDRKGQVFMDYLEEYGHFEDVPFQRIYQLMRMHYPHIFTDDLDLSRERLMQLTAQRNA